MKKRVYALFICLLLVVVNISFTSAEKQLSHEKKENNVIERIDLETNQRQIYLRAYDESFENNDVEYLRQKSKLDDNLAPNPSFEDGQSGIPDGWQIYRYPSNTEAVFLWNTNEAKSGDKSIGITNMYDADHYLEWETEDLIPFKWSFFYDYDFTVWYKHNKIPSGQNQNFNMMLECYDENQEYLIGFGWFLWKTYSIEWTQYDFNVEGWFDWIYDHHPSVWENTRFARIELGLSTNDDDLAVDSSFEVRFDDVYFTYKEDITPDTPIGPDVGNVNEELTYTVVTGDPLERNVFYKWDWGDGSESEWLGPFESEEVTTASHAWSEKGIYAIKTKAKNSEGDESDWSQAFIVGIPMKNNGEDQDQTECENGYGTWGRGFAQSFIPTENTLSQVSLRMFKKGDPGKIKISIRKDLNEDDLIFAEMSSEEVSDTVWKWFTFDFQDIATNPGETYYIVWTPYESDNNNLLYWGIAGNDPYTSGCSWECCPWQEFQPFEFPNPDFCFKTYYVKNKAINNIFYNFLRDHPNLFPMLQRLLKL